MGLIGSLIVGGLLGWLAGLIVGRNMPGGIFGNIIAGIVGGWLGGSFLGEWGPALAGFFILPTLIGAAIFIIIITALLNIGKR